MKTTGLCLFLRYLALFRLHRPASPFIPLHRKSGIDCGIDFRPLSSLRTYRRNADDTEYAVRGTDTKKEPPQCVGVPTTDLCTNFEPTQ